MHDDKYIVNHMLQPFLKWIKRKGNELYVWRAETQANGNIHFHITTNRYLHWESIRNKWNDIQRNNGYIKAYMDKGGDNNPNSTDVKGVKDARRMAAYMVKYMSKKTEGRRAVTCKVWSCSSKLEKHKITIDEHSEQWNYFKQKTAENCELIQGDNFMLMLYSTYNFFDSIIPELEPFRNKQTKRENN